MRAEVAASLIACWTCTGILGGAQLSLHSCLRSRMKTQCKIMTERLPQKVSRTIRRTRDGFTGTSYSRLKARRCKSWASHLRPTNEQLVDPSIDEAKARSHIRMATSNQHQSLKYIRPRRARSAGFGLQSGLKNWSRRSSQMRPRSIMISTCAHLKRLPQSHPRTSNHRPTLPSTTKPATSDRHPPVFPFPALALYLSRRNIASVTSRYRGN